MISSTDKSTIKKRNYDTSAIISNVKRGYGFYEACISELDKNIRPSRRVLNDLVKLFRLTATPELPHDNREDSVSDRLRKSLCYTPDTFFQEKSPAEKLYKLKRNIYVVIDSEPEQREESELNKIPSDLSLQEQKIEMPFTTGGIDDNKKYLLYNMLIAKGLTPDEARTEIENIA